MEFGGGTGMLARDILAHARGLTARLFPSCACSRHLKLREACLCALDRCATFHSTSACVVHVFRTCAGKRREEEKLAYAKRQQW